MQLKIPRKAVESPPVHVPVAATVPAQPPVPLAQSNPFAEQAPASTAIPVDVNNPYAAPSLSATSMSNSALRFVGRDPRLASRGRRFMGALLDNVCYLVPVFSVAMFAEVSNLDESSAVLLAYFTVFLVFVVNAVLITARGQSIGKILLGTQIVKERNDQLPGFVNGVLLRSIVPGVINVLPFVGGFFGLADALFIFGEDRQCLHDKIASTKVLDINLMRIYAERYANEQGRRVVYPWER